MSSSIRTTHDAPGDLASSERKTTIGRRFQEAAEELRHFTFDTAAGRGGFVVVVGVLAYLGYMIPLLRADHYNFGTQNFDVGIFDQAAYQLSNFDHFLTTRGLNVFGHHANFGLYLLVPLYWVGLGGVNTLNIVSAVSLAGAAIPIYMIALKRIGSATMAALIAFIYLMNFSVSAMTNEGFHPEKMALPSLFLAVYFAMQHRWRWFAFAVFYSMMWKEDIALFVFMLGLYIAIVHSRKAGAWTSFAGAGYFLFATRILLPGFNNADETFYGSQYGELGSSGAEVAANAVLFKQSEALRLLQQNDAAGYFFDIGQPFGMVSYMSPHWLLLSLPHFAVNLLNIHGLAANPLAHYVAIPVVASTLAVIATLARFKMPWLRWALCVWMLIAASTTMVSRGFTPISENYDTGVWQIYENDRAATLRGALAFIPDDAVVMATYDIVPQISHRSRVYMYPNPFEIEYWGIGDEQTDDPDTIEYIALNRASIDETRPLHLRLDSSASFELLYSSGEVVVFKRIAPGL